jgi:hypothetical protein
MGRGSRSSNPHPVSRAVESAKLGAAEYVRQAMHALVAEGYAEERTWATKGTSALVEETLPDFVTSSSASRRDEDEGKVAGELTSLGENGHQRSPHKRTLSGGPLEHARRLRDIGEGNPH